MYFDGPILFCNQAFKTDAFIGHYQAGALRYCIHFIACRYFVNTVYRMVLGILKIYISYTGIA